MEHVVAFQLADSARHCRRDHRLGSPSAPCSGWRVEPTPTTVTRVDFGGVTFEDLMVNGQPGETNDITVSFAANPAFPTSRTLGTYTITDQLANITPGPGCTAVDLHEVQCDQLNPLNGETIEHDIVVDTGDLADHAGIASTGQAIAVSMAGNNGDDELVIVSTPAAIRAISGGAGDDRLGGGR